MIHSCSNLINDFPHPRQIALVAINVYDSEAYNKKYDCEYEYEFKFLVNYQELFDMCGK